MDGKKFTISQISGAYEQRVFIGGNYDSMPVLREIEKFVREFEFFPILAHDCEMASSELHDQTLLLLHSSKYAIFEATRPSGELMELERIRDYGTIALLVYQVKSGDEMTVVPGQISQMLATTSVARIGYPDFATLRRHIQRFLLPRFLVGKNFTFVAIRGVLGRNPSDEETRIYGDLLESRQITEYQLVTTILQGDEYNKLPEGQRTNKAYIQNMFKNLLDRIPKDEELALALSNLGSYLTTKQQLLIDFIQLDEVCDTMEGALRESKRGAINLEESKP